MEYLTPLLNYVKEMNNKKGINIIRISFILKIIDEINENVENSNQINTKNSNQETTKLFFNQNNGQNTFENNTNNKNDLISQLALQILKNSNGNNSTNNSTNCHQAQNITPDILNSTNLINELISLEQQNRIQIELIKRLIQNKQQNINYVNNILENFITKNSNSVGKELENHTTKGSSNSNDKILDENQRFLNLLEENKDSCKNFFKIKNLLFSLIRNNGYDTFSFILIIIIFTLFIVKIFINFKFLIFFYFIFI